MGKSIWKDTFVLQAYELAKSGMKERNMAKALGISFGTFALWERKKPLFRMAIKAGRKAHKKKNGKDFSLHDFIAGRLSEDLRDLWHKINRCDTLKNGTERLEALLADRGVRARQALFFHAFIMGNYTVSPALRKVNISRSTFELWKKDPEFLRLFEECKEIKGDFFEEHLCMLVAGGNPYATIMANQTYNRHRGYGPKVDVNVGGEIRHSIVPIDSLNLSLKERKQLLSKIRKVKQVESKAV